MKRNILRSFQDSSVAKVHTATATASACCIFYLLYLIMGLIGFIS